MNQPEYRGAIRVLRFFSEPLGHPDAYEYGYQLQQFDGDVWRPITELQLHKPRVYQPRVELAEVLSTVS